MSAKSIVSSDNFVSRHFAPFPPKKDFKYFMINVSINNNKTYGKSYNNDIKIHIFYLQLCV